MGFCEAFLQTRNKSIDELIESLMPGMKYRQESLLLKALTRANEKLILSRPLFDEKGHEIPLSNYWTQIRRLVPDETEFMIRHNRSYEPASREELLTIFVTDPNAKISLDNAEDNYKDILEKMDYLEMINPQKEKIDPGSNGHRI